MGVGEAVTSRLPDNQAVHPSADYASTQRLHDGDPEEAGIGVDRGRRRHVAGHATVEGRVGDDGRHPLSGIHLLSVQPAGMSASFVGVNLRIVRVVRLMHH